MSDGLHLFSVKTLFADQRQGTLDAMLHGSLWDPEDDVKENVGGYVAEVSTRWRYRTRQSISYIEQVARVLKPGGSWLYVTYRQPHFLEPLLARPGVWDLKVDTLADEPGAFEYFGFVMTKHTV